MHQETGRRALAAGMLAGLVGCAEVKQEREEMQSDLAGARARRNQPPLLTATTAGAGVAPAATRPSIASDLLGAWQMLVLPPAIAEQVNTTSRFSEEQQYFLITQDGRIGQVLSPAENVLRLDRSGLTELFAREPNYDSWTLVDGKLTIATPSVVGFPSRRDIWRVETVTGSGALLGLAAQPADVSMSFIAADGSVDYRRVIRRLP